MDEWQLDMLMRVITMASAAATNPDQWVALVAEIGRLFAARSVTLFTPEPAPDIQPFGIACGDLAFGLDDYFAHWAHNDAWLKAVEGTGFFTQAGDVRFTQEFLPDKVLCETDFFNEWAVPYSAEQSLALKVIDASDRNSPVMHLTLFKQLRDAPFSKQDKVLLRLLWPHLQRAAQAHWQLRTVWQAGQTVENALNILPTAVWVVRNDFHIEFANTKAHELMRAGTWAQVRHGQLLTLGDLDLNSLSSCADSHLQIFTIAAMLNKQLLQGTVRAVPIAETALYANAWPRASTLLILEIAHSQQHGAQWLGYLAQRFNLTPTQCLILESLSHGLSVQEISKVRKIKEGTVRAHLHEIFCKTGQSSQVGLMKLVLGG